MDINTDSQAEFIRILNLEIEQAQRLLGLLEQEYQLLQTAPAKPLENLLSEKRQQLKIVEESVAEHHRFLRRQDLSCDRAGTLAFIEADTGNPLLAETWQRFESLLAACQKQNQINGGAVTLNQRQTKQMLDILLGISTSNKTYSRSGESRSVNGSNSLGKA
jgi:flagellar biosynthesis/type III secretory pathway chaperone